MTYKKTEWEYYVGQFMIYPSLDGRFAYVDHPDLIEQIRRTQRSEFV